MRRGITLLGFVMAVGFCEAQVTSNFSSDADGWTAADINIGSPQTVVYNSTGGNPGGYISMTTANPQPMFWYAPSKFMGNRAYTSYGETLTFDVMTAAATAGHAPGGTADIMLTGGSTTIYLNVTNLPSGPSVWTPMSVLLHESANWHTSSITGPTATRANIIDVLSNLSIIRIYVSWKDFPSANTLGSLDNVTLNVHASTPPVPVISTVSPLKAATGSNVTISGSNFGSNAANNTVYFGKKKATIVNASSTSITATVPLGADYGFVSVTNTTTNRTAFSQKAFTPMFASGGGARIIKGSFSPDVLFSRTVGWLGHGDINGDGRPEMLASMSNFISIYENISTPGPITSGSFATRVDMSPSLPDSYVEINMADLDSDGKQDVFFAFRDNPDQGRIGVLRNIHTSGPITSGSFATPQEFTIPPYTGYAAAAADLDGDGRPELISWGSSCGANPIYILQNLSTPGDINFTSAFSLPGTYSCGSRYSLADLDLDGKIDIVETGGNTRIIRNTSVPGTLSFDAGFELGDGGNVASIGDLDNDGRPEIVFSSGGMKIYKNVSTPGSLSVASFQGPVTFLGAINTAKIADINGDGKPDVITGTSSGVGVYENVTPDGQINVSSFRPVTSVKVGANATELDVFDIDVDGRPDIISNNGGTGNISVNQNVISGPPTITNISPTSASAGATVTITGTDFSSVTTDNVVYFGAARATVNNASPTSLTVVVPNGATYNQVSVSLRGFTIYSNQIFTPTFSGGASFDATSFASSFDLTIAQTGDGISTADFDGDGKVDVLADNNAGVSVFRNIGAANVIDATTFATAYTVGSQSQGQHLRSDDLDGDGKPDISTTTYIARNSSNSALPNPITFDTQVTRDNNGGGVNRYGPARDLNNDGKIDIYYTSNANIYYTENQTYSGGFIAYGLPQNSFAAVSNITKPASFGTCVAADLDGDGFNDIAATNPTTNNISVFLNAGQAGTLSSASFAIKGPFAAGNTPQGIAALDFDGDGKIDLAVANSVNSSAATLSVFRNTSTVGNISFTQQDFQATAGATEIAAADLDGDGKPDIVTANVNASSSFSVFRNTSTMGVLNTSSFAAKVDYALPSQPRGLAVADLDRDLRPDIVITRATTIISIFRNLMPLGPSISFTQQPGSVTTCENATTTLSVIATGANNLGYQWQIFNTATSSFDNLTNNATYSGVSTSTLTISSITPTLNGKIYRCVVTGDSASPKTSNQATLTVSTSPSAPATSGDTACKGASLTLTASGSIDGNYRWYDSPTSPQPINGEVNSSFTTPVIFNTTTFYAAIINNNGCVSTRTAAVANITSLAKPVISSDGTLLCGVNTVTISGPNGFAAYHWSNGESTQDIDVSFAGAYSLIVEDANACLSLASDPIFVTAGSVPKPVLLSDKTNLCAEGDEIVLAAPEGFTGYEWSNGADTQTITVTEPGTYNVRVTNSSGCRSETSDDLTIGQGAQKPVISVGANVLVSTPAKTYQWYYGEFLLEGETDQFLQYNPFAYGVFTVAVTDFSDCASTSDPFVNLVTAVEASKESEVVYPNPFTDRLTVPGNARLLDATGKVVMHLIKGENNVSHLSRGLYFVTSENDNEFKTTKVSK